jgi:PPM family protein phosphatase
MTDNSRQDEGLQEEQEVSESSNAIATSEDLTEEPVEIEGVDKVETSLVEDEIAVGVNDSQVDEHSEPNIEDVPHEAEPQTTETDLPESEMEEAAQAVTMQTDNAIPAEPEEELGAQYLEEESYPTTSSEQVFEVGSALTWGDTTFVVERVLAGGWYQASIEGAGDPVLLRPEAQEELWNRLPQHRLLPRALYSGPEGDVLPWIEGEKLSPLLPFDQVLEHIHLLAQLVRFLELQQQAVLYIDPESLVLTEMGLRLRFPPQVSPLGEELPKFYREGYTAPEVQEEAMASGKEGVYLLAALLLQLLTGQAVPPEGPSRLLLMGTGIPGLPQLLSASLAPPSQRLNPEAFARTVKALKDKLGVSKPIFHVGAATTVGLNPDRPINEDSYGYVCEVMENYGGAVQLLRACVADGMGGEAAGELASKAAVQAFCSAAPSHPLDSAQAQADWTLQLAWQANQAVLEALSGQDGGCTFTAAILFGDRLSLAHVGDTRAYLCRAGNLTPLTKDHSLVSAMLASGMITEKEAETSPDRNKVLRSLGSVRQQKENYIDDLSITMHEPTLKVEPGDIITMVSDGVWGEVKEERLLGVIKANPADAQAIANGLVKEALEAGAPDNATALIVMRVS